MLVLFEPSDANLRLGECFPHAWELSVARLTGFFAASLSRRASASTNYCSTWIAQTVVRLRGGHAVIVGFGEIGRVQAMDLRKERRVVAIDHAPDTVLESIAHRNGILLVRGDARQPTVRAQADIAWAERIVVATGDDMLNLALGRLFAALPHRGKPRNIKVSVDSPLVRRAFVDREHTERDQQADSNDHIERIELFSVEDTAARLLCRSARVQAIADLLGQPGIHIVLLGFAPIAERVIAHTLHGGPIVGFGRPRISVLCAEPVAARQQLLLSLPCCRGVR